MWGVSRRVYHSAVRLDIMIYYTVATFSDTFVYFRLRNNNIKANHSFVPSNLLNHVNQIITVANISHVILLQDTNVSFVTSVAGNVSCGFR